MTLPILDLNSLTSFRCWGIPIHGKVSLNRGCVHWTVSKLVRMIPPKLPAPLTAVHSDDTFKLSVAGGVTTALVLPGSANAIGGQASLSNFGVRQNGRQAQRFLSPLIGSTGMITSTQGLHAGAI